MAKSNTTIPQESAPYVPYPSTSTMANTPSSARGSSNYDPLDTFVLPQGTERHYSQQFADMYFLRLAQLKKEVKAMAHAAWDDFSLGGQKAQFVERVLDVRQGELCWAVGTVFMDMAAKPNVLDDISKEHHIVAPPQLATYMSPDGSDEMMLEDESGRLRISGETVHSHYVTGCILAALGTEQADGTFQVIATQYADLPRQPARYERQDATLQAAKKPVPKRPRAGKIAIVSGLDIAGQASDLSLDLLVEYLSGESGHPSASQITRLIIAGDSLASASPILTRDEFAARKSASKLYGYDASSYNAQPVERLDTFLSEILPSLPITLVPGASDPANVALPQQPLHPALFPKSRAYAEPLASGLPTLHGLHMATNPFAADVDGARVLVAGGQTVADLLKYVDDVSPLSVMEMMLRWRCIAPTAPDTLWCYPFQDADPMIVSESPHVYVVGCQSEFGTKVIESPRGEQCLLVCVPRFAATGCVVLVDLEGWGVEVVEIGVRGPQGDV
jgi:DNA polymerase delta subunit 2